MGAKACRRRTALVQFEPDSMASNHEGIGHTERHCGDGCSKTGALSYLALSMTGTGGGFTAIAECGGGGILSGSSSSQPVIEEAPFRMVMALMSQWSTSPPYWKGGLTDARQARRTTLAHPRPTFWSGLTNARARRQAYGVARHRHHTTDLILIIPSGLRLQG